MVGTSHPNPLHVVETAVEVADLAWTALDRHRDHVAQDVTRALEEELAQKRSENQRLKVALEECQKTLEELKRIQNGTTETAGQPNGALGVHQPSNCPDNLHEQLKRKVDSPAFLGKLQELQNEGEYTNSSVMKSSDDLMLNLNHEDPSWWLWITNDLSPADLKEEIGDLDNDSYVIVSEDDVVEGIATFIARYALSNPLAKNMTPEELQEVVSRSFAKLNTRGRIRQLWSFANFLYITASWSGVAIGLYKNPFLLRGAAKAISTSCKLIHKILA